MTTIDGWVTDGRSWFKGQMAVSKADVLDIPVTDPSLDQVWGWVNAGRPDVWPPPTLNQQLEDFTVYISGPISGMPQFNHPAFHEAARKWKAAGYTVIDPTRNFGGRTDLSREEYLRMDIGQVLEADALAVLPGWENSDGARLEVHLCTHIGTPIVDASIVPDNPQLIKPYDKEWLHAQLTQRDDVLSAVFDTSVADITYSGWPIRLGVATDPFEQIVSEIHSLHAAKRSDYTGGQADILANYRNAGEFVGLSVLKAMLGRMAEKFYRIKVLTEKGGQNEVKDESYEDTLRDVAIIAILCMVAIRTEPGGLTALLSNQQAPRVMGIIPGEDQ